MTKKLNRRFLDFGRKPEYFYVEILYPGIGQVLVRCFSDKKHHPTPEKILHHRYRFVEQTPSILTWCRERFEGIDRIREAARRIEETYETGKWLNICEF